MILCIVEAQKFFYTLAYIREGVTCLVVAMYQDNAQIGWLQLASILYCHIIPLANVIDVDRDAGISTWMGKDGGEQLLSFLFK